MKSTVVYLRPTEIAYVTAASCAQGARETTWRKLFEELGRQNGISASDRAYGLAWPEPAAFGRTSTYDAGVVVQTGLQLTPRSMLRSQMIPGGSYLRVRSADRAIAQDETLDHMLDVIDAREDLVHDARRPNVEIFLFNTPGDLTTARLELCVPVRPVVLRPRPVLVETATATS